MTPNLPRAASLKDARGGPPERSCGNMDVVCNG